MTPLRIKLLRVLQQSPLPVSTPELVTLCAAGRPAAHAQVWAALRELQAGGVVTKAHRPCVRTGSRGNAKPVAVWSLARFAREAV